MYGDLVLPGGARLRAQGLSAGASFASWRQNPLRKRLRLRRMIAWVLCFAVLAVSGVALAGSIRRSLILFVQVPAVVEGTSEGRGSCRVQLSFIFDGQARTGTYHVNTSCVVVPRVGGPVSLKVNPEDPQDVVIVGHEASDPNLPLPIGLAGGAAFAAARLYLIRSERSWRRAGLVDRKSPPWLQLTATVSQHKSGLFHEMFVLESEGSKGQPTGFQMRLHPWPEMPKPGQQLTFHLLSDGSSAAILALGERPWYRLATISTPYVAPRPHSG
jgi:hypothetical protein